MPLLLASALAVAAESTALPMVPVVKEAKPVTKQAAGAGPKPVERKAVEAPKSSRNGPKERLPRFEEKNLGLGCAQS